MGKKLVTKIEDVRRMGNEGEEAWWSRLAVAESYLAGRREWPECRFRLWQVKGEAETRQIPDLTLECRHGLKWAIEIGTTGSKRVGRLEDAGINVVKVGRGRGFDFNRQIAPTEGCPDDCAYA